MRSLRARLTLLTAGVLLLSLATAVYLAYQLLLSAGQDQVDDVLQRESRRFARSVSTILQDQRVTAAEVAADPANDEDDLLLRQAVERYLLLHPDTEVYRTVVRFPDGRLLTSDTGSDALRQMAPQDLPPSPPGAVVGVEVSGEEYRSLSAPVVLAGRERAELQVIGATEEVRDGGVDALAALVPAALLSAALGAGVLTLTVGRSLAPLTALSRTASSTALEALDDRVDEPSRDDEVGRLAREFNLMLDRLQEAASSRMQFMAAVSHELRTPLTICRGHLELLQELGPDRDPATAETLEVVQGELLRMGRLVDDLMALARSESRGFLDVRAVELPSFVEALRRRLAGLGLDEVVVEEPPDVELHLDPDRITQALLNLVYNASVHTPEGTVVRVSAAVDGSTAVLSVCDEGPGIDDALRERLFEPFVAGPRTARHRSTGLGLAVVAAVAEAHGGSVALDTGPAGSTFRLVLPQAAS